MARDNTQSFDAFLPNKKKQKMKLCKHRGKFKFKDSKKQAIWQVLGPSPEKTCAEAVADLWFVMNIHFVIPVMVIHTIVRIFILSCLQVVPG